MLEFLRQWSANLTLKHEAAASSGSSFAATNAEGGVEHGGVARHVADGLDVVVRAHDDDLLGGVGGGELGNVGHLSAQVRAKLAGRERHGKEAARAGRKRRECARKNQEGRRKGCEN